MMFSMKSENIAVLYRWKVAWTYTKQTISYERWKYHKCKWTSFSPDHLDG